MRNIIIFALILFLLTPNLQSQGPPNTNALISEFYNNFTSKESNKDIKEKIERLIKLNPENPHLYSFLASVEWTLIGRELGLSLSETKNLSKNGDYAKRIFEYRKILEEGLKQAELKSGEEKEIAKAEILLEHSKLQYRFLGNLRDADKISVEITKSLRNSTSCHKYFFLGTLRFGMSEQGKFKRFAIYLFSESYKELAKIDPDVFSKNKSIEWLEIAQKCGFDENSKKLWIENEFFLINAYDSYRQNVTTRERLTVLEKEFSVVKSLNTMFPKNKDLAKKILLIENEMTNYTYLKK